MSCTIGTVFSHFQVLREALPADCVAIGWLWRWFHRAASWRGDSFMHTLREFIPILRVVLLENVDVEFVSDFGRSHQWYHLCAGMHSGEPHWPVWLWMIEFSTSFWAKIESVIANASILLYPKAGISCGFVRKTLMTYGGVCLLACLFVLCVLFVFPAGLV